MTGSLFPQPIENVSIDISEKIRRANIPQALPRRSRRVSCRSRINVTSAACAGSVASAFHVKYESYREPDGAQSTTEVGQLAEEWRRKTVEHEGEKSQGADAAARANVILCASRRFTNKKKERAREREGGERRCHAWRVAWHFTINCLPVLRHSASGTEVAGKEEELATRHKEARRRNFFGKICVSRRHVMHEEEEKSRQEKGIESYLYCYRWTIFILYYCLYFPLSLSLTFTKIM